MTGLLDIFASIWYYWMFLSFGIGIIGFILLIYYRFGKPKNKKKTFKIGVILLGQTFFTWMIGFGTLWIIQKQARQELKVFLDQPSLTVKVNGEIINPDYSKEIMSALKTINKIDAHHSSPTDKIKIEIASTDETVNLSVEQDSEIETEYWIFWEKYNSTKSNEIGRIRTEIFKNENGG